MINKNAVRAFMAGSMVIIGEWDLLPPEKDIIRLIHPFRVVPDGKGNSVVASIFAGGEEWCQINPSNYLEIHIIPGLMDLYVNYESEIFGSLVAPPEKKIIL